MGRSQTNSLQFQIVSWTSEKNTGSFLVLAEVLFNFHRSNEDGRKYHSKDKKPNSLTHSLVQYDWRVKNIA